MRVTFADTFYYFALVNPRDQAYSRAAEQAESYNELATVSEPR
jgi:hypothetical protein